MKKEKYILEGVFQEFERKNINSSSRIDYSQYLKLYLKEIEGRKDLIDKSIKNVKISLREIRLDKLLSK